MKNKTHESLHLIRFPDCDPFNHLNNSRYLDYFINAREDHLIREHQFNVYSYAMETGTGWVVSQNQIAYCSPVFLMEKVWILSAITDWGEKVISVEMQMWDEKKSRIKSLLWIKFTHIDLKTQKSILHVETLSNRFKAFEMPLAGNPSFEDRVGFLKSNPFLF